MSQSSPPRVILASGSPRRREIAASEGWALEVIAPAEEVEALQAPRGGDETLDMFVMRLARAKGRSVLPVAPPGIVLACDTLSEVDGLPLGKPADEADARRMLQLLSGRHHRVVTGTWLFRHPGGPEVQAATESQLFMQPLSQGFLESYLASGLWRGKAGACGFQDGAIPLQLVSGSASNVVGLPQETVRAGICELLSRSVTG